MKTNKDDLKGLCFSIILIVSGVLTYVGGTAYTHYSANTIGGRLLALPMCGTLYLLGLRFGPDPSDLIHFVAGLTGAFFIYFAVGVVLLYLAEYLIRKRGGGGGGNKGKSNRV
jgi:hypothetical protein